jgi:hypothetical protein
LNCESGVQIQTENCTKRARWTANGPTCTWCNILIGEFQIARWANFAIKRKTRSRDGKSEDNAAPFAEKGTVYVYGRAHTHPPNSLTLPHEIDPFSVFGSFVFQTIPLSHSRCTISSQCLLLPALQYVNYALLHFSIIFPPSSLRTYIKHRNSLHLLTFFPNRTVFYYSFTIKQ